MRFVLCIAAAVMLAGNSGVAETHLALILSFEKPTSEMIIAAMRAEVERLFAPVQAVIELAVLDDGLALTSAADHMIFIDFEGECRPGLRERPGKVSDLTLGHMYSVDNQLQAIARIRCSALGRHIGPVTEGVYGRALARIVAHEMYHYLTQRSSHGNHGLFTSDLSAPSLTGHWLDFDKDDLGMLKAHLAERRTEFVRQRQPIRSQPADQRTSAPF